MNKLKYFLRSLLNIFQKNGCPYCGSTDVTKIQRKYLVTTLLKCKQCGLQYRFPKDKESFLKKFYQVEYNVDTEMMTYLPSDTELKTLKENNFANLRDFEPILKGLMPDRNIRIVDYGCSWGYNVYKLKQSGIDAEGYELSVPRAEFGKEKLGVKIATDEKAIRDNNDFLFSSHVIEHLTSIGNFIELGKQKLKKDGIFIAFCPNGSKEFKASYPDIFAQTWGGLHPNYLDIEFASYVFRNNPFLMMTSDWPYNLERIRNWDGKSQVVDDVKDGYELMIVAKPNTEI